MRQPRKLSPQALRSMMDISLGRQAATTWIYGGQVLNVFSGELLAHNIAIAGDRIAYVGPQEPKVSEDTTCIEASGMVLVPGYIEPHAHSFQTYNPLSLSEFALTRGTTTMLHDNLPIFMYLERTQMEEFLQAMWEFPVKNYWWCRIDPQVQGIGETRFDSEDLAWMMSHPFVLQAGEFTDWKRLLDGNEAILRRVWKARKRHQRIETHNPGSSVETLAALGAAGITACHESLSGDDVLRRVRLGYYAALRHSSIRPDLPHIIRDLLAMETIAWDKMYFTTDGSPPFYLEHGFIDYCIRVAIEAGLDPILAYRMASHHAAVYYRIDHEVGGIAPGRIADIVFLEDLRNPTPVHVMADGVLHVKDGHMLQSLPDIDWPYYGIGPLRMSLHEVDSSWFSLPKNLVEEANGTVQLPIIEYVNAVITRCVYEAFDIENGHAVLDVDKTTNMGGESVSQTLDDGEANKDTLYCSLLNREGQYIVNGLVRGLGTLDALATSISLSGDVVVLGTDRRQMASAANRVIRSGGAISMFESGKEIYFLPLPLFGLMSTKQMDYLIPETKNFVDLMRNHGYQHEDPIYSLLFLTATHLPNVRMTPHGVFDIRRQKVLIESVGTIL